MSVKQSDWAESKRVVNCLKPSKYETAYVYLVMSLEQLCLRKYLPDQAFDNVRRHMNISLTE
jgi:histidinol phosphatase-like enzyme